MFKNNSYLLKPKFLLYIKFYCIINCNTFSVDPSIINKKFNTHCSINKF